MATYLQFRSTSPVSLLLTKGGADSQAAAGAGDKRKKRCELPKTIESLYDLELSDLKNLLFRFHASEFNFEVTNRYDTNTAAEPLNVYSNSLTCVLEWLYLILVCSSAYISVVSKEIVAIIVGRDPLEKPAHAD